MQCLATSCSPVFQELHERQPENRCLCQVPARKHCLCLHLPGSQDTGGEPHLYEFGVFFLKPFNRRRNLSFVSLCLPFRSRFQIARIGFYCSEQRRKKFKKSAWKSCSSTRGKRFGSFFTCWEPSVKAAAQSRSWKIWPCLKPQLQVWKWTKSSHWLGVLGFFIPFPGSEEQGNSVLTSSAPVCSQVDLSDLESKIEKKKLAIEEAKAQAKGLVPEGVPSLDNTSGFSPIPKNGK